MTISSVQLDKTSDFVNGGVNGRQLALVKDVFGWIGALIDIYPSLASAITSLGGGGGVSLPTTSTVYFANTNSLLEDSDPTIHEVASASSSSDHTAFRVVDLYSIVLPAAITPQAIFATFRWSSLMNMGSGRSKWMISQGIESVGSPPTGSAIDLTQEILAGPSKTVHSISGLLPSTSIPTGPALLMLVSKPDAAGGNLSSSVFDESSLEITF